MTDVVKHMGQILSKHFLLFSFCFSSGPENDSQADSDGEADRQGEIWRGVDGQVEGRKGSC